MSLDLQLKGLVIVYSRINQTCPSFPEKTGHLPGCPEVASPRSLVEHRPGNVMSRSRRALRPLGLVSPSLGRIKGQAERGPLLGNSGRHEYKKAFFNPHQPSGDVTLGGISVAGALDVGR